MQHTNKELILTTKRFTGENRLRSWFEVFLTLGLAIGSLTLTFIAPGFFLKGVFSITTALLYVRLFVIYHDYQHHSILQKSKLAAFILRSIGVYLLAPQNVWKRSHDHHHNHNSKLTLNGIGSYPTISTHHFARLTKAEKRLYLVNRHPLIVLLGHFTLFIYWLNVKSFVQSPKKHQDSLLALIIHVGCAVATWYFFGGPAFLLSWLIPFTLAFGIGSYLFYCQHNFPGAHFNENHDWKYDHAALSSTSFMVMSPLMRWFTGNIGYHHVHHLNSRIPFYRLPEAMAGIPELHNPITTTWNPLEMLRCFRLKLWDPDQEKMIGLKEFKKAQKETAFARPAVSAIANA